MKFLRPQFAIDWWTIIKNEGVKAFIKQKGWKFFIAFILFYLIRDVTLYIIIPYFAISKINGCE
jgi:uncharacterized membrane protein YdjX (TVP38/TMEM64 family)